MRAIITRLLDTSWFCCAARCCPSPAMRSEATLGKNEQPIHDAARMGTRQDVEKILKANRRKAATHAPTSAPLRCITRR
jgi:hypothetical protein